MSQDDQESPESWITQHENERKHNNPSYLFQNVQRFSMIFISTAHPSNKKRDWRTPVYGVWYMTSSYQRSKKKHRRAPDMASMCSPVRPMAFPCKRPVWQETCKTLALEEPNKTLRPQQSQVIMGSLAWLCVSNMVKNVVRVLCLFLLRRIRLEKKHIVLFFFSEASILKFAESFLLKSGNPFHCEVTIIFCKHLPGTHVSAIVGPYWTRMTKQPQENWPLQSTESEKMS